MPSVVRSKMWFTRIDGNKEFLIEKCKEMKGWLDCKRAYGMYHTGEKKENPHCHIVIELETELQHQSFNARIKNLFKIEKRSQYSSKVWDGGEGAVSYMFHELSDIVVINKDFDEGYLSKCRELNNHVQKVVDQVKDRAPKRVIDRLVEGYGNDQPSRREILKDMLNLIRSGEMYEQGDYRLKSMVEEVYLKTRSQDAWDDYCEERFRNIFRD